MDGSVLGPLVASQPSASSALVTPFNATVLADYLSGILQITLGATKQDLEAPGSLFHEDRYADTLARLNRYASEPAVAIYAMKNVADADGPLAQPTRRHPRLPPPLRPSSVELTPEPEPAAYVYTIDTELTSTPTTISSLAIIKRPLPLDANLPLHSQLQVMNLPGTAMLNGANGVSPFEILHALVHSALAPYFDAYTKIQDSQPGQTSRASRFADAEAKTGMFTKMPSRSFSPSNALL